MIGLLNFFLIFAQYLRKLLNYVSEWHDTSPGFICMGASDAVLNDHRIAYPDLLCAGKICLFQKHYPTARALKAVQPVQE
jgi:hypothetical protein